MVAIQYTDYGPALRVSEVGSALARAALAALDAPSALDARPWRWRIDGDRAELHADRSGWLPDDPDGRLVTLSGGAALHHATVALAAGGVGVAVRRLPDAAQPDLLAVLHYIGPAERSAQALRLYRAIALRHSDGRAPTDGLLPAATMASLQGAAERAGGALVPFGPSPTRFVITAGGEGPRAWLGAGEALSAVLLAAAAEGLVNRVERFLTVPEAARSGRSLPPGSGVAAAIVGIALAGRIDPSPGGRP